jgi:aldose 1-epimerase
VSSSRVSVRPFGTLPDGGSVELYVIRLGALQLSAITLGAIITSLRVPDRDGHPADVVLGHDTLDPYLDNTPYLGALVGRYANRIARGRFRLGGVDHQLATNEGAHHLHGGRRGFDRHRWAARPIRTAEAAGVAFERVSPAGEEQYPGTLRVAVTYLLTAEGVVTLQYEATTDAPTIVNLTQHTYFNLAGERSTHVLDHELTIAADAYTPVGPEFIPTGEIASVAGTPFDFRVRRAVGARTQLLDQQQPEAGGFDHNFVLEGRSGERRSAAWLRDPVSGRRLEVATTEPGLQFYSGHKLDGSIAGAYGRVFHRHAGLCLETQHFPDTPNQPLFPPVTLEPYQQYASTTVWRFTAG